MQRNCTSRWKRHPDVAIVDIRMPPTFTNEGLRAAIELAQSHEGLASCVPRNIETRYAAELLATMPQGSATC